MNILDIFTSWNFYTKTAIINADGSLELSYGDLIDRVEHFFEHSFEYEMPYSGDRVLIMTPYKVDAFIMFLSTLYAGCIPVMVNPQISKAKLAYIIEDCKPSAIYKESGIEVIKQNLNTKVTDKNVDFILYTSGSLGEQKGVLCTLEAAWAAIQEINEYLDHAAFDRILSTLPLHHSYGLYQALCTVAFGGTIIFENGFTFPAKVLEKVKQYQVTGLPLVPTSVAMLLNLKGAMVPMHCKSLRYITTAGANLPETHKEALGVLLPNVQIIPMYGQTECVRITWKPPVEGKEGSVGKIMNGMEAMILDEDNWPILEAGKIGQLVVTGPNIMNGYLNKPEQEAKSFNRGWLCTGDMFYKDDDGFYWFCGRSDDIAKVKGEKVSPIEIESVLNKIKAVQQAIVTFAPDDISENVPIVHIVLDGTVPLSRNDIMRFCKQNLESHLMPKTVRILDRFPLVEGSNKIDRQHLKKMGIVVVNS